MLKKRFATTAAGIDELSRWLADLEVERVVMESTGVYWKPVYYGLEGLFAELWLVNARHVKNVPGRKTDMADAEWLADVAAHGMVRPSLVPQPAARELRELTRYRKSLVTMRAQEVQRLDKVLQDAGIKISSVASTVLGKSTRAMVEALIAGERDPAVLAAKALGKMRPKIPVLTEALVGRFAAHHAVVARAVLGHIDFLDRSIAVLDQEVVARLGSFWAAIELLKTIPGVGQTVAEVFVAETGGDMSRFPSASHLAAWAGVAPANHESAGKRRPSGTRPGSRWLRRALTEAAKAAARTKGTYLSAQYHHIAVGAGLTRPPSPSPTPFFLPPGTCSPLARFMTTSAPTGSSPGATPSTRPVALSHASKPSGTPSPSPPPRASTGQAPKRGLRPRILTRPSAAATRSISTQSPPDPLTM